MTHRSTAQAGIYGDVDRIVRMPLAQATSCAFAGRDLDRIFVASASVGLDATARARQPLAGGLFEVSEPGAQGLAPGRFACRGTAAIPWR